MSIPEIKGTSPTPYNNPREHTPSLAKQCFDGAALGAAVTMILTPGLYLKNMVMIGQKPLLRDCFKGVFLNGANVVPQTAVQIGTYAAMKRTLFPGKRDEELSFQEKLLCAGPAGALSGAVTVGGEMIVQTLQKGAARDVREAAALISGNGGVLRFTWGTTPLAAREVIWAATYLSLQPLISSYYAKPIANERVRQIAAAGTAGAIGGILTTPMDLLRARMQDCATRPGPQPTYAGIVRQLGAEAGGNGLGVVRSLFRGVVQRSAVVAVACILMTEGKKLLGS